MPTTHELQIEGHKIVALGFNEDKPGTPAIFLHGIGGSVSFWSEWQTPVFNERFRWYSLSLPGHYPAVLPPGFRREALTPEMIARVLTGAIRELVSDVPVMLVGYSTGGFAALAIAAQSPELVRAVISVGGFAYGRWTGPLGMSQWLAQRSAWGEALFRLNYRAWITSGWLFRLFWRMAAARQRDFFALPNVNEAIAASHPDALRTDVTAMLHYYHQMPHIDISDWLPRITAPVLVINGDSDPTVPPAQSRLIAEKVPNSTHVIIKGAGHLPMFEQRDEYVRVVTDWALRWG